jgi:hypothetical protein
MLLHSCVSSKMPLVFSVHDHNLWPIPCLKLNICLVFGELLLFNKVSVRDL